MPDEPSATRTTVWHLSTDVERDAWDRWAEAIKVARHPSLARVVDVSRTDDVGTLTVLDPDSESVIDWAGRTDASVPERLAILRAAAAAIDSLHAVAGVPHGGISTSATRVAPDGSARLVGFSPWTGTNGDEARYLAPELDRGTAATRSADAYAFARMVADVLGGSMVTAAASSSAVVDALRSSPNTRRRPRLVRALQTTLMSPPEARQLPLTAWLTSAVEGTAATEVTGTSSAPVRQEPSTPPGTRRRRLGWPAAIVTAAAVAALIVWSYRPGGSPSDATTSPTSSPTPIRPFSAVPSWAPSCGATSGIAADSPPDVLADPTSQNDLDAAPEGLRVGRWHSGRLLVTLTAPSGDEPVLITGIGIRRDTPPGPTAWVAQSEICDAPPRSPDLGYDVNLDEGKVTLVKRGSGDRFTGDAFTVGADPIVIAFDVTACQSNYAWQPLVHYVDGNRTRELPVGPVFYTYGLAGAANIYRLGSGKAKPELLPVAKLQAPPCGLAD